MPEHAGDIRHHRRVSNRLQGQVAFITGAGGGIGACAAELFAREGARVAVAELDEAAGVRVAGRIRSAGGEAFAVRTDVTNAESVENAIKATAAAFGKLDILYNNVGGTSPRDGPVTEVPLEVFWSAINRDLFGSFLVCRFGIPELTKAGGGSVINTASLVAMMGKPRPATDCYVAAKGPIVALTRSMAVQYVLRRCGESLFRSPHGIFIAPDDTIYRADDGSPIQAPSLALAVRPRASPPRR